MTIRNDLTYGNVHKSERQIISEHLIVVKKPGTREDPVGTEERQRLGS
jgi:hypothetical protein